MGTITRTIANNLTAGLGGAGGINFRNKVINGAMEVAQVTTSALTINSGTIQYPVDRMGARGMSSAGVFTVQRSTDVPDDFKYSVKATVTTNSTPGTNDTYRFIHHIEGKNIRTMNWGSSSAKSMVLSFYVKSSLTGTFGGSIANGDYDRFYNFSYTINSANTWERKSVTIAGDTTGNWNTGNSLGLRISLSLGAGSGEVGSAGSWGTSTYEGVTGQTNLIATNGATWYITGLQFEEGSSVTDYEQIPEDVTFKRCQRYLYMLVTSGDTASYFLQGYLYNSSILYCYHHYPLPMRSTPSLVITTGTGNYSFYRDGAEDQINYLEISHGTSASKGMFRNNSNISGTAGQAGGVHTNGTSNQIYLISEI